MRLCVSVGGAHRSRARVCVCVRVCACPFRCVCAFCLSASLSVGSVLSPLCLSVSPLQVDSAKDTNVDVSQGGIQGSVTFPGMGWGDEALGGRLTEDVGFTVRHSLAGKRNASRLCGLALNELCMVQCGCCV